MRMQTQFKKKHKMIFLNFPVNISRTIFKIEYRRFSVRI